MWYDKEFPAGQADAVPESCFETDGKLNVMRVATSLFVPHTSLPTTPPANIAKRPWPWDTPHR
eukprot:5926320-Karenia_brevis.AAC.1